MEKLLLLLVVAGCAAVVIIMIYLISRVEKIEDIAINGMVRPFGIIVPDLFWALIFDGF